LYEAVSVQRGRLHTWAAAGRGKSKEHLQVNPLRHQVQVVAKSLENRRHTFERMLVFVQDGRMLVFKGSVLDGCETLVQGAALYRKIRLNGVDYKTSEGIIVADELV